MLEIGSRRLSPVVDRLLTLSRRHESEPSLVTIVPLTEENRADAVGVLAEAFADETFIRTSFDGRIGFEDALEGLIEVHLRAHLAADQPGFVATVDDCVVGVAVVDRPGYSPSWRELLRSFAARPGTIRRLLAHLDWRGCYHVLRTVTPPETLPSGYYTLEAIGVDPDAQGQGVGRALLEAVHDLVESDPGTPGCYLVTADEPNWRLYRRVGYRTAARRRSGDLEAFHMFRFRD